MGSACEKGAWYMKSRILVRVAVIVVAAAVLVGALVLGLTQCRAKPQEKPAGEKDAFRVSYTTPVTWQEEQEQLCGVFLTEEALYYGLRKSGETADTYLLSFYRIELENGEATALHQEEWTADRQLEVNAIWAGEQGGIWYLRQEYGAEKNLIACSLVRISADGTATDEVDVLANLPEIPRKQQMAVAGERVYIYNEFQSADAEDDAGIFGYVLIYDSAQQTCTLSGKMTDFTEPTFVLLSDGRPACMVSDKEGGSFMPISPETGSSEETVSLGDEHVFDRFYHGSGDTLFLAEEGEELYGYRGGKPQPIVNYQDWGLLPVGKALAVRQCTDGSILRLERRNNTLELCRLTPCTQAEAARVLTIAGYHIETVVEEQAAQFNRSQSEYIIRVLDYSAYDKNANMAGMTRLETELLAGDVPDMLYTSNIPAFKSLAKKGALLDLYTFLDADEELNRDSFVEGLLPASEIDGGVYRLPIRFALRTYLANRQMIGDRDHLRIAEVADWAADQSEVRVFSPTLLRERLINDFKAFCLTEYVDWENGTCDFTDGSFAALLELANTLPNMNNFMRPEFEVDDGMHYNSERLANHSLLLAEDAVNNFGVVQSFASLLRDDLVYAGFPSDHNNGNVLKMSSGLAITTACAYPDTAWQFIRQIFLAEDPTEIGPYREFPALREAFDYQLAYYMDEANFVDENGAPLTGPYGNPKYALTESDVERFMKVLREATANYVEYDQQIADIIETETSYYFGGACTAEEAAEKVQSRVQLYIHEQR